MLRLANFAVTVAILVSNAAAADAVFVLEKDRPVTIVLPDAPISAERTAAEELATYLGKMTGAPCIVVAENEAKHSAVYLGSTTLAKQEGIDCEQLGKEAWILRAKGGNLIVAGGRPRGTLYGAYDVLERLGVVWPDVDAEFVPEIERQEIEWDVRAEPAIMNRCIYSGVGASANTTRFFVRNKMNAQVHIPAELGGSEAHGAPGGCHTFHAYTTPEWPDEWFALHKNGQRVRSTSGSGPSQFCLTNPEVRKAVCAQLRAFIERDRARIASPNAYPRIYDISHNDCHGECHCPGCLAILEREGAYSGVLLDFINFVAADIAEDYPDIFVQTFAYTFTLDPPKHIKPADNVLIRVCKLGCEFYPSGKADTQFPVSHPRNQDYHDNFLGWAAIAPHLAVWDYWIIYTKPYHPPYLNARHLQEDIRFYRNHNVKTMFVECEAANVTSFFPLKFWFGLKMMQDPDQSYDELAEHFCRAFYGPAAEPMLKFINYLQDRQRDADVALGLTTPNALPYLDREFFTTANSLLDEAERLAAGDPAILKNIGRERVPVDAALLNLSRLFKDDLPAGGDPPCDLLALFDRYEKNSLAQAERFYNSDAYARNQARFDEAKVRIETDKLRFTGQAQQLPAEFEGKEVVDVNWTTFGGGLQVVDDADGVGGKAGRLPENETRDDYHMRPFNLGIYNRAQRKILVNRAIPPEEIPQDGKFHLYHLGKFTIEPTTIVWVHWTWLISIFIDTAYLPDVDNEWNVYASIKLVGNPYQKDSQEKPQVLVDRVLLVR
ncbi:MAG: DUF4838 domain-containing protein [Thermoguttaceae bacterium]|jgi:hypothetical protein|nr:DUF4838 domain-containing protein [Thermoguttaceae bacterium]